MASGLYKICESAAIGLRPERRNERGRLFEKGKTSFFYAIENRVSYRIKKEAPLRMRTLFVFLWKGE
ncbi:MAG: hypothetical protein DBX58_06480 [Clostridiales bacterium]|nr:MAG: hypothetical protein DBX58_06480 [Clostridiales bacterium]